VWQVESLAASGLDVYAHNIETVYPTPDPWPVAIDNQPLIYIYIYIYIYICIYIYIKKNK